MEAIIRNITTAATVDKPSRKLGLRPAMLTRIAPIKAANTAYNGLHEAISMSCIPSPQATLLALTHHLHQ